jgi:hypothetical protein
LLPIHTPLIVNKPNPSQEVNGALSSEHWKKAGTDVSHSILGALPVLVGAFVKIIATLSEEKKDHFCR